MAIVFQKPSTLTDAPLHYCPGCTHGIVHRLVAQALEELTTAERRQLCDKLGAQWLAEIFPYYDEPGQLLAELSPKMAAAVTDCMESDVAAWVLE